MRLLLTYFLILSAVVLNAQEIRKTALATAGKALTNSEYSIDFTIGEPIVGLVTNENSIDQGFWASTLVVAPISIEKELEGIMIYPNPVETELNILVNNNPVYAITLFGVDGKRTLKKKVDPSLVAHKINLSHLSKGVYVLRLFVEGTDEAKMFKIIKK